MTMVTHARSKMNSEKCLLGSLVWRQRSPPIPMRKKNDALAQFSAARSALISEREAIQKRLQQIEVALNGSIAAPRQMRSEWRSRLIRAARRRESKMGVREAIAKVTSSKPLSVREIVEAVQDVDYKFASKHPENSVGAFLYSKNGKKHFKMVDGKFSPK